MNFCYSICQISWKGKIHWGVTMEDGRRFFSSHLLKPESDLSESNKSSGNLDAKNRNAKRAVSSLTESALLVDILRNEGYDVIEAAGAGYKILAVIQGNIYMFLLFLITCLNRLHFCD